MKRKLWLFAMCLILTLTACRAETAETETPIVTATVAPATDAFARRVEEIKTTVREYMNSSDYDYNRRDAIDAVTGKLQTLLRSEEAAQLTGETFDDDFFSVKIKDFPLTDCTVRRIVLALEYDPDENYSATTNAAFFLEYAGDAVFFSDWNYCDGQECDFGVFETGDGVFAILLKESAAYAVIPYQYECKTPSAHIYHALDGEFAATYNVAIPLVTDDYRYVSDRAFALEQSGGVIRAQVLTHGGEAADTSLFDTETETFFREKTSLVSGETEVTLSEGLLLGLSDHSGNIRTLWLRQKEDRLYCDEISEQIVFPRQGELYSLKNYIKDIADNMRISEAGLTEGWWWLDCAKLLCAPLGADITAAFEEIFDPLPRWGTLESKDIPLYVGEDYVCYARDWFFSGGGSGTWSSAEVRFDRLDDLPRFHVSDESTYEGLPALYPDFEQTYLADLVFGADAEILYQDARETYIYGGHSFADFRELAIMRGGGRWSLALPTIDAYTAWNGNGGPRIGAFAPFSYEVPASLVSDKDMVREAHGVLGFSARDYFKAPSDDIYFYLTDYRLAVSDRSDANTAEDLMLEIPVKADEYIVSINWASGRTLSDWESAIASIGN
jgi:hypothetical protein